MLNNLTINNYKCLTDCSLELKPLNLFAGPNSSGKSTVLQALLTASDNVTEKKGKHGLKNRRTEASNFNDVRNFVTNAKSYEIGISYNGEEPTVLCFTPGDDSYQTTLVEQSADASSDLLGILGSDNLLYLPATRPGGAYAQPINPDSENKLGRNGEFVIDYYAKHRLEPLDAALILAPGTQTLEGQVNHQLDKLTGYRLVVETVGNNHYVKYETRSGKQLFPYHVGTGVSFITEVIIACFATPRGGMVITENPEIHLHPKAQADLIDFMTKVAKAGVQIIIESHSDHLFNGIRRLISQEKLALSDVSVYNFRQDGNGLTRAERVEFTPQGGIRSYIPGMFEQFDIDLDAILKL